MQRIARFPILMSTLLLNIVLVSAVPGLAANREADRVKESGTVLKEILGMPDNIPTDLLKKARCVLVLPSVKKLAIGVGGSYGRGVMTCRGGESFREGGRLQRCMRSKARILDFSWAGRLRIF